MALTLAEKLGGVPEQKAIDARDKALGFYVEHFVDRDRGGEFAVVDGGGHADRTQLKGQAGKIAYHTVELYRYLIEYANKR